MEKELKSSTGVLLRADLAGYGHPTLFGRKGLDGDALLGQPSKGHPHRNFNSFSIMFYHIISTTSQQIWRPILPCSYFWTFAQCVEETFGSIPKIYTSFQSLEEMLLFEAIFKIFGRGWGQRTFKFEFWDFCPWKKILNKKYCPNPGDVRQPSVGKCHHSWGLYRQNIDNK